VPNSKILSDDDIRHLLGLDDTDAAHHGTKWWHVRKSAGTPADIQWLTFSDLTRSIVENLGRIRNHPLAPASVTIYGFICHIHHGALEHVPQGNPNRPSRGGRRSRGTASVGAPRPSPATGTGLASSPREALMTKETALLIVDDNENFVSACELFLKDCGFRVMKAFSGTEAVDMCAGEPEPVSLAIVDLNMPELDGPATIGALKKQRPGLKIVAISGAMLVPYFVQLNDLGVRHFLPKPFYLDGLLESIRLALS
jgi:CheY-like chemotaxis protein